MCSLCSNIFIDERKLNQWLQLSSYDDTMPYVIIYKNVINFYLYSKVGDHSYNEDTKMLINYCPVCGRKLENNL